MAVDCLGAEMSVTEYMQGAYIYIYILKSLVWMQQSQVEI